MEPTVDQDTFNPDLPSGENATPENTAPEAYDYAFVSTVARIARYDDLMSAPHVTEIPLRKRDTI